MFATEYLLTTREHRVLVLFFVICEDVRVDVGEVERQTERQRDKVDKLLRVVFPDRAQNHIEELAN